MIRRITFFTLTITLVLLQVMPAAGIVALTDVSYTPTLPLVIGRQQHVTATYYVAPSGSTTFIRGHQLQMETGLANAQWNIQVLLNSRNAAQQSASGSVAFVNGEIMSYPTTNDVYLDVTIDGDVLQTHDDLMTVLQVEEIDNSGNVVPGSVLTISQPLAGQPATTIKTVLPTPAPTIISPSPTKSAGFPVISGIFAISLIFLLLFRRGR
jgi:hypothetical protein